MLLALHALPRGAHEALWRTLNVGYFMQHDAADICSVLTGHSFFRNCHIIADLRTDDLPDIVNAAGFCEIPDVMHIQDTSVGDSLSGRACRRCGGTVRVAPIGPPLRERPMFYCPGCQGGLGPTDSGRVLGPLGSGRR